MKSNLTRHEYFRTMPCIVCIVLSHENQSLQIPQISCKRVSENLYTMCKSILAMSYRSYGYNSYNEKLLGF